MWRITDAVESWSWEGCEGKKASVTVYSDAAKVELFVNGKSYGKAMPDQYAILEWKNVELQPGENEIKVVSINKKVKLMDSFRCKL